VQKNPVFGQQAAPEFDMVLNNGAAAIEPSDGGFARTPGTRVPAQKSALKPSYLTSKKEGPAQKKEKTA